MNEDLGIFIKKFKYFQIPFIVGQVLFHFQWCLINTASAQQRTQLDKVCPLHGGTNQINQVVNQKVKANFFSETLKQKYDWSYVRNQLGNKKMKQIMSSFKWMF